MIIFLIMISYSSPEALVYSILLLNTSCPAIIGENNWQSDEPKFSYSVPVSCASDEILCLSPTLESLHSSL